MEEVEDEKVMDKGCMEEGGEEEVVEKGCMEKVEEDKVVAFLIIFHYHTNYHIPYFIE